MENDADPHWVHKAAERTAVLDRIGNPTLVTGNFNRDVSNLGWDVKRPEFEKQRSLVINYAVAQSAEWDEACVAARAKQLAEAACRVWTASGTLLSDA